MDTSALLIDAFTRVRETVHRAVDGLDPEELAFRPDRDGNSIAWLVWHLTRIQDDHIAEVAGLEQVWTAQGRAERFGLPFPVSATGYGHGSDDVAAVRVDSRGPPASAITTRCSNRRPASSRRSPTTTSTASSTSHGIRRCRSAFAW